MNIKQFIWCLTDRNFRSDFLANGRRQSDLRHARNRVGAYLHEQFGRRIVSGPFEGTQYVPRARSSFPTQQLLGMYEKELWPIVETIVESDYAMVIDIGAAEGYYVVGLARRMPNTQIIAFEANRGLHRHLRALAELNGVEDRVILHGTCSLELLNAALTDAYKAVVICDVEGAEDVLLDPRQVPQLRRTDILVEVHEHLVPGVCNRLLERFSFSHDIAVISSVPRTAADWPLSSPPDGLPIIDSMDEVRGCPQDWIWMKHRGDGEPSVSVA